MMNLRKIAMRSLSARPWVTTLTVLSLTLPTALIVIIIVLRAEGEGALKRDAGLVDLVVGAKGSPLQLVLSSLYHLDQPTGNIFYHEYETLAEDERVRTAIPIALGDNYEGYRIVGTKRALLQLDDEEQFFRLADGRFFREGFEAVLGAQVVNSTGLDLGSEFQGTHGLLNVAGAERHDQFTYRAVGVLEPTGTALDRSIFVPLEIVWKVHNTERSVHHVFGDQEPIEQEVTAVLVELHSAGTRMRMADELQKTSGLMAAIPVNEILRFSRVIVAPFQRMLLFVTVGVVIVANMMVGLSLYQSVERKRRDMVVLRCIGARQRDVIRVLFYEVLFIALLGVMSGWVLGHLLLSIISSVISAQTGLILDVWAISWTECLAVLVIGLLALAAGMLPVFAACRQSPLRSL